MKILITMIALLIFVGCNCNTHSNKVSDEDKMITNVKEAFPKSLIFSTTDDNGNPAKFVTVDSNLIRLVECNYYGDLEIESVKTLAEVK